MIANYDNTIGENGLILIGAFAGVANDLFTRVTQSWLRLATNRANTKRTSLPTTKIGQQFNSERLAPATAPLTSSYNYFIHRPPGKILGQVVETDQDKARARQLSRILHCPSPLIASFFHWIWLSLGLSPIVHQVYCPWLLVWLMPQRFAALWLTCFAFSQESS